MAEDKKLSGNDYMKKCDEAINSFQKNLANAVQAYGVEENLNGLLFAVMLSVAYMQFVNKVTHFMKDMESAVEEKDGENND